MSTRRLTDSGLRTGNKFSSFDADYPYTAFITAGFDDYNFARPSTVTMQNGDIVIAARASNFGIVSRMTQSGSTVWSKIFNNTTPTGIYSIAKDSSDNIYILTFDNTVLRLNPSTGAIDWQSKESVSTAVSIFVNGSYVYTSGGSGSVGNANGDGILTVLNTSNGTRVGTRYLRHPSSTGMSFNRPMCATSSYLFVPAGTMSVISGYTWVNAQFMRSNFTGSTVTGYMVAGTTSEQNVGQGIAADSSNIYVLGAGANSMNITKIPDTMGSITFTKKYTHTGTFEPRNIFHNNGMLYVSGRYDAGGYEHHFVAQVNASDGTLIRLIYLDDYYTQNFGADSADNTNVYLGAELWDGLGNGRRDTFGILSVNQNLAKNINASITLNSATRKWVDGTSTITTTNSGFSLSTPSYSNSSFSSTTSTPTYSLPNAGINYRRIGM